VKELCKSAAGGEAKRFLCFGELEKGDSFGELSCLLNEPNIFSVATTEETVIYKIHKKDLLNELGGKDGGPANVLKSKIVLQRNLLDTKLRIIKSCSVE